MKNLLKFAAIALAAGLWSCSDDAPEINTPEEESGDFYAKITLQLPTNTGSRSQTKNPSEGNEPAQSTDGYEIGKDYENNVTTLYVILATKETDETTKAESYNIVTWAEGVPVQTSTGSASSTSGGQGSNNQPSFVMQFPSTDLMPYAGDDDAEFKSEPLYIFAICNPTAAIKSAVSAGTLDLNDGTVTLSASVDEITAKNGFLMTNGVINNPTTITDTWETLSKTYSNRDNPYDLTPKTFVRVERVACRFDFQETTIEGEEEANVYPVYDNVTSSTNVKYANVTLTDMAIFNIAKTFYLLRHTQGANATTLAPEGVITLCGNETPTNYVVSPNWEAYSKATKDDIASLASSFFDPLISITTSLGAQNSPWVAVSSLTEEDSDGSSQSPTWKFEGTDYKIFNYATENTIGIIDQQRNGITTGVAFRAVITPATETTEGTGLDNKIAAAAEAKAPIYAYRPSDETSSKTNLTMIFGTTVDIYNYVATHKQSPQYTSFVNAVKAGIFEVSINGSDITAESLEAEGADVDAILFPTPATQEDGTLAEQTVVVTVASGTTNSTLAEYNFISWAYDEAVEGYPCYYYYFNRHNDNLNVAAMGPMEFATVRNNIYKLTVDNILTLGLPGDITPDPWTPDENPEVYFKVSVKVLDWVVRKNNIVF